MIDKIIDSVVKLVEISENKSQYSQSKVVAASISVFLLLCTAFVSFIGIIIGTVLAFNNGLWYIPTLIMILITVGLIHYALKE